MSLEFRVAVAPDRSVRVAWLLGHAVGLAGLAFAVPAVADRVGWPAAAGVGCLALTLAGWSLRRALGAGASGELSVDARGAARWRADGAASEAPLEPLRWHVIGPLVRVDGRCDGREVALACGVESLGEAQRCRLLAWLRWLDRGGGGRDRPAAPAPRP